MSKLTGSFLDSWHSAFQVAVAIFALISSFVTSPPVRALRDTHNSDIANFNHFLIGCTLLVILTIVAKQNQTDPALTRRWLSIGLLSILAGVLAFGTYRYCMLTWTCEVSGTPLVIGDTLTTDALSYSKSASTAYCADLLDAFASDPYRVWESNHLNSRLLIFDGLFTTIICLFSLALISLIEAHKSSTPAH